MTVPYFLDTNVLFYAAMGRENAPQKRARANELVAASDFGVSTQVLQEFYWNVTRKTARPLTPVEAMEWIELLERVSLAIVDPSLIKAAILHAVRYQITYWDAAIVAAAERLGASTLYTEDLSDGQTYGSVRVVNPFAGL